MERPLNSLAVQLSVRPDIRPVSNVASLARDLATPSRTEDEVDAPSR